MLIQYACSLLEIREVRVRAKVFLKLKFEFGATMEELF